MFEGYLLKECGCFGGDAGSGTGGSSSDGGNSASPCASECASDCSDPSGVTQSSPCGQCLLAQADEGTKSPCTEKAGLTDCGNDSKCEPFLACALSCPGN